MRICGYKVSDIFTRDFLKQLCKELFTGNFSIVRILIILMIGSRFIQLSVIPTDSMFPTLKVKDLTIATKDVSVIKRGDIINFEETLNKKTMAKRVIAMPGETIEIIGGQVYIDGKPLIEPYIIEEKDYDMGAITMGEDEYFMLGDNRPDSVDSRVFGPIKKEYFKSKIFCIVLPISRFGSSI